ncbi:DNA type IV secretion system protein ComB10 [Helicobacter sp. UBA3407]|uniref:DNA type IV secretion system protein ComB10 n=1 Tax=Helicobacter sp. UBA3407 TaxID=1946588 RepID=UPI0026334846|nr:DNA type IV secretion system protein ComB10 [Helicobacter sp. UBA3407]
MKKLQFTSCFLSLSLTLQPLLAEDILKSDQDAQTKAKEVIKQMQEGQEIKKQDFKDSKIHKENLQHLFDTKFPVDDYIYKAGKRQPNEQEAIQEILSLIDDENAKEQMSTQETKEQEQSEEEKAQEQLRKTQEQEEKLKAQNQQIAKEVQLTEEQKLKALLRASILSERNAEINTFNKNSKFGSDGFSNQKSLDISTNEHKLYRSIRAGRLIPALLTSAISSDLSGIITAQIEQDIYASMGEAVLIPRGSKAIGFYNNEVKMGQKRLEIKWREIITPQGVNIMLTDAIVADNMGMSGAVGSVNNKFLERYGIAYGISTLTNVLLLSIAGKIDNANNGYAEEVYSQAKSDINTIVQDIISRSQQIQPTIEIKSGSRIFIVPTNHMWFSKPKNNEVLMKYFEIKGEKMKEQITKAISQEEFLNIKNQYFKKKKNKQKEEKLNAKILEQIKVIEKAEGELLKEQVKLTRLLSEKAKLNDFAKDLQAQEATDE